MRQRPDLPAPRVRRPVNLAARGGGAPLTTPRPPSTGLVLSAILVGLVLIGLLFARPQVAPPSQSTGTDGSPKASAWPSAWASPSASPELPVGSARAILASEADFITGDWPILDVPWERLRYNGRPIRPRRTNGLADARGVPLRIYRREEGAVFNPTVLAEEGMMRLDSWLRTQDRVHLRRARRIGRALDGIAIDGRRRRWQPHPYGRFGYEPGWVNANSHGLVLSFFSRLHGLTGNEAGRATADRLFAAYDPLPGRKRWFTDIVDGHLWFEHYPASHRGQVLNAHLNAVFGLYDYWRISADPEALRLLRGGIATVRDNLDRFRRPRKLSAYSLTTDFVSEHYHDTHVRQLRILARMTGDDWFSEQVERFQEDGRAWRARQGDRERRARRGQD